MITIVLAGAAYTFMSSAFSSTASVASSAANSTATGMMEMFSVEGVSPNSVYVRNIGQTDIANVSVYLNDKPANFTAPGVITKGQLGTISIRDLMKDGDNITITTSRGTTSTTKAYPCRQAVLCLSFDEGSGTIASDSSKNSIGTLGNGLCNPGSGSCPIWVQGMYGNALSFDGGDYVNVSKIEDYNLQGDFTLEAWIKPSSNMSTGKQVHYNVHIFSGLDTRPAGRQRH